MRNIRRNIRKWLLIAGLAAAMQTTVVCDLPDHGSIGGIDYDVYYDDDYHYDYYYEDYDDDCWFNCGGGLFDFGFGQWW